MDILDYDYHNGEVSNRLLKVKDNGNAAYGFSDSATDNQDFWYDANGNMVRDLNKGIGDSNTDGITYNHLNLPTTIVVDNAPDVGTISYIYDATGAKLRKNVLKNGNNTPTDYAGNYVYENGNLKQFSHAEGYVEVNGNGDYDYVYSYLDHLGTVRLTYSDFNGNGSIEPATEILQERNTYPFGLEHKGYNNVQNGVESNYQTYLGQEMNKELGLNWLSFRHRNYDPTIGRFFGIDPISEEFLSISTYQFAHNNPVWKIELEGLEGEISPEIPGAIDIPNSEPVTGNTEVGTTIFAVEDYLPTTEIRSGLFNDDSFQGAFTPATDVQYDLEPITAFLKDASFIGLSVMGIDAIDNTTAVVMDPDVPTGAKVSAVAGTLPTLVRGGKGKGANSASTVSKPMTSRAARRQAMRDEGIPTSQQPSSQSKNASGREYTYTVPKKGGGTQKKSVQQQTKDRNHDRPHWEAGAVKMDNTRVRMNRYKRPKLTNNKSKVEYDE